MRKQSAGRPIAAWWIFGVTSLAVFMVALDATVVVAVFPALRQSFESSPDWLLSWILNAYTIVYAALLVPAGRWVDRCGHSRAFFVGLTVFTVASGLCGLATDANLLIAARMLRAVGAAVLTPAALAVTLEAFPQEQRPFVVGLWSAFGALAAALGPAVGSWLVDLTSWAMIFWLNVPVGLAGWWFARQVLPASEQDKMGEQPDWIGSLMIMAGVSVLCVALVRSSEVPAAATLEILFVGMILLAAFVAWVRRHPVASRDFSIFQKRNVGLANLATFVFGAAFGMMFLSFFFFMTGVWRFSQSLAGLAALHGPLVVIPSAVCSGRLAIRFGQRPLLIAGGVLFAFAHFWYFLRVSEVPDYFTTWLPGQIVAGLAIGLVLPSLTSQALAGLDLESLGIGSAVNLAVRQVGGAVGIAATVAIISYGGLTLPAFRGIYLLLALAGFSVAAIALGLGRDRLGWAGKKDFGKMSNETVLNRP